LRETGGKKGNILVMRFGWGETKIGGDDIPQGWEEGNREKRGGLQKKGTKRPGPRECVSLSNGQMGVMTTGGTESQNREVGKNEGGGAD